VKKNLEFDIKKMGSDENEKLDWMNLTDIHK
jgi:hypothetical protein